MKRIALLLIMSFFALNIYAQKEDSLWIRQHYIKKEQYIPMRDGIRLYTVMYIPTDAAEKHPILMVRTPYSSGPYGVGWMPAWKSYLKEYFKEGYCYVTQDVRGKYL